MLCQKTSYFYDPVILKNETQRYIEHFTDMDQLSIKYDPTKNLSEEPHLQCVGRSPNDITDWNFSEICPIFKDSVFSEILNQVKEPTKRIRLMRMRPRSSYSFHKDQCKRLHWALITFPGCHITFQKNNGEEFIGFHIPANGYGYITDTQVKHTAINPTLNLRYHLVIDIIC